MKRKYCILSIIISAALLAGCLSACGESSTIGGSSSDENTAATVTGGDAAATPDTTADVEAPDVSGATTIALSGQSAAVTGTSAEVTDGVVTITAGGTYVVTGTMTEGRILVNAPKEEVTLVLQDASITCSTGSPLYVYKSKATTLYLPEGTASTLTDGTDYTFSDSYSSAEEEEPNACLYSKSDLIIAGSGSLTVNANYNNGITGKDTLFIQKASVTVTAGDTASADTAIATINQTDRGFTVKISITNEQAKKVKVGDTAELVNYWGDATATLETIGNDPQNPQKNRQLTFRLTGSDIQPDSNITLAIGQKSASYDAIVPTSAIRTDNNGSFVLAIVSKSTPLSTRYTATRVDVQVLASDDKSSAVSGIGSGEFVITTSTKPIEAGTQVRLAENG